MRLTVEPNTIITDKFPKLAAARLSAHERKLALANDLVRETADFCSDTGISKDTVNTRHGISATYEAFTANKEPSSSNSIWDKIGMAWVNPARCDLGQLSADARKCKGVATLAHIKALGSRK